MRRRLALLFALLLVASLAGAEPVAAPDDSGWGADKCVLFVCPSD
jgi:hypothetical protein